MYLPVYLSTYVCTFQYITVAYVHTVKILYAYVHSIKRYIKLCMYIFICMYINLCAHASSPMRSDIVNRAFVHVFVVHVMCKPGLHITYYIYRIPSTLVYVLMHVHTNCMYVCANT